LANELRFEICVDSVAGVLAAREAGADRVELCASLIEGGITPSLGTILVARKVADIGIHAMIRPRGGDFLHDADEIATMEADIASAKSSGVDGVVFGVLDRDGRIDRATTERLIARARPVSVTFHRAFDMTPEPLLALETLIELGVDRVLTSGQEPSAFEGAEKIAELVKAAVDRIVVMPGGGITAKNVGRIVAVTGAREIHFAARTAQPSAMRFRRADMYMGGELRPPEYDRLETKAGPVAAIIAAASRAAR
jgi:copper homeostasis protein